MGKTYTIEIATGKGDTEMGSNLSAEVVRRFHPYKQAEYLPISR